MKNIYALVLFVCMGLGLVHAQQGTPVWGAELDLVQPFVPEVNIFTAKVTRTVWGQHPGKRGDIMLGAFVRPNIEHDVVERISEHLVSLGYRHYLYKGLHLEA